MHVLAFSLDFTDITWFNYNQILCLVDKFFSLPSSWVVPDLEAFEGRSLDWNLISGLWKRSGFKWLHFNYSLITYHKWETLVKSMMFGNDVAYSDIIPTIFGVLLHTFLCFIFFQREYSWMFYFCTSCVVLIKFSQIDVKSNFSLTLN